MNIKKAMLEKFLKAVVMDSSAAVTECILNFKEDGLHLVAFTGGTTVFMQAHLKATAFDVYEAIGEVPLGNLKELYMMVDRFTSKEQIKFDKQDPFFVLEGTKNFKLKMVNKEVIEPIKEFKVIEGENTLTLSKEKLKNFLEDLKVVGAESFKILVNPGMVTFLGSDTHECNVTFLDENLKEKMNFKFGPPFAAALAGVQDDMTVVFKKEGYPIQINYVTDNWTIRYVVAPLTFED